MTRTLYAAGNWKMNGRSLDLSELRAIGEAAADLSVTTLIGLPATLLDRARETGVMLAGQDCHGQPCGAHTGDIAAEMLRDAGATHVILGHSERRTDHAEDDALISGKVQAAWDAGLIVILCIGESEAQYRAGETLDVLREQVHGSLPAGASPANTIVAYEPIWAIGTGLTPTIEEIQTVHARVRAMLPDAALSILYGGSVKPANAAEIFGQPDVDGGLVGGASLKASDFVPIMQALEEKRP